MYQQCTIYLYFGEYKMWTHSFNNNLSHLDECCLDLQWLLKICKNMGFSILSVLTQLGQITWKPVESLEAVPIIISIFILILNPFTDLISLNLTTLLLIPDEKFKSLTLTNVYRQLIRGSKNIFRLTTPMKLNILLQKWFAIDVIFKLK